MQRHRTTHTPEFKMRVLTESFGRDCTLSDFRESRNVPVQTYYRWLAEYNKEKEAEKEADSASADATAALKG